LFPLAHVALSVTPTFWKLREADLCTWLRGRARRAVLPRAHPDCQRSMVGPSADMRGRTRVIYVIYTQRTRSFQVRSCLVLLLVAGRDQGCNLSETIRSQTETKS
jgi:hypothetical protein